MKSLQVCKYYSGKVVKSNSLVEAKYDLTLIEQKLLSFAISKIDISAADSYVKISVQELCSFMGTSTKRYTEIRKILIKLRKRDLIITQYDHKKDIDKELIAGWINNVEYKDGWIEIEFPRKLMPYFVELKERYTMYDLWNICHMSGKFAFRIYEILKEHEFKRSVVLDYEKIRDIMCIKEKFSRYYDFKKNVLIPAQEEIEKLTDIRFEYNEIKTGRSVSAIEFKIYKNKQVIESHQQYIEHKKKFDYFGETNVIDIIEKYKTKTTDELADELHSLIESVYNTNFDKSELYTYDHSSLMRVVFGIVDGEYKDVKKPVIYFRSILNKLNTVNNKQKTSIIE